MTKIEIGLRRRQSQINPIPISLKKQKPQSFKLGFLLEFLARQRRRFKELESRVRRLLRRVLGEEKGHWIESIKFERYQNLARQ